MTSRRILREHEDHHPDVPFDFYCVAHETDYSPAYLDGGVCHDQMADGYCHPNCNRCPQPCPIKPCPWSDDEA